MQEDSLKIFLHVKSYDSLYVTVNQDNTINDTLSDILNKDKQKTSTDIPYTGLKIREGRTIKLKFLLPVNAIKWLVLDCMELKTIIHQENRILLTVGSNKSMSVSIIKYTEITSTRIFLQCLFLWYLLKVINSIVSLQPSLPVFLKVDISFHLYRCISTVMSLQSSLLTSLRSGCVRFFLLASLRSEFLQSSLHASLKNTFLQSSLLTSLWTIFL